MILSIVEDRYYRKKESNIHSKQTAVLYRRMELVVQSNKENLITISVCCLYIYSPGYKCNKDHLNVVYIINGSKCIGKYQLWRRLCKSKIGNKPHLYNQKNSERHFVKLNKTKQITSIWRDLFKVSGGYTWDDIWPYKQMMLCKVTLSINKIFNENENWICEIIFFL